MTTDARRGAWEQLAEALGGGRPSQADAPPAPPGWDRLRDALTGSGPSQVADQTPVGAGPAGPSVPGGWAQLRRALDGAAGAGGAGGAAGAEPGTARGATAVLDREGAGAPGDEGVLEAPEAAPPAATQPGDRRGGPIGAAGRVWATRRGKGAVALVAAAAVAAGVVLGVSGGGGGLSSRDAFSVNGQAVSVAEFTSELKVRQTLYGITPPATSATAKYATYLTSAAQAEAVSMLLDQVAPKEGVTVSTQTAQDSLNQAISQQYGGDQTSFANALSAAGLNEDQVLTEIRHNLVYQKLFAKIAGSPTVTTVQVTQYFDQHRAQLAEPATRQISHIVVATKAAAESVLAQLKAGKPFATLAAADSLDSATKANGGQLGLYAKDDLQAAFADAAFAAPPNVPFGPVEDSSGAWDVGVVTAVHPAAAATLTATTSKAIQTLLVDQAEAGRWDTWLGNQIKGGHIVYAAKYRPAHPDMPPTIPVPQLTGETLAGVGAASSSSAPSSSSSGSSSGSSSAAPSGATPGG